MKKEIRWLLFLGGIFIPLMAFGFIFSLPLFSAAQSPRPLMVVTSIFPLQEFAKAVGGERIGAVLLLPPGAEPHTWEPRPSDVVKISQADIFIYIGAAMEPWVDKVIKAAQGKRLRAVEASRGLSLLEAKHGEEERIDPHVWLDFSLDLKIVDMIAAAFAEKDTVHGPFYRKNAETYKDRLLDLDQKYRRALAQCRHRRIILSGHTAFGYLAKRYGLEQLALSGISPNAEPTPKRMAEVIAAIKKEGIKFIFAEEIVNPKLARALAKEVGVGVLLLNPGANLTQQEKKQNVSFIELMEKNLKNLQKGMQCQQEKP